MSQQLINHSSDLKRLRDEGYGIKVVPSNHLLLEQIPYVNSKREIRYGTLVSVLTLNNNVTIKPNNHVVYFIGEQPCDKNGVEIAQIQHSPKQQKLSEELVVDRSFSNKPVGGYKDYYDKMVTYATILSSPAEALEPSVTAKTFPPIEPDEEESVFHYIDTASSRAGISAVTAKLESCKVAIIGLGGTGSYILDFVAKTPVKEIHLFDGDEFLQHNAFRAPGAPPIEVLKQELTKVEHFNRIYSSMHRKIYAHELYIDEANTEKLRGMSFAFICLDKGEVKRVILESLEAFNIPFVDVGMGLSMDEGKLGGLLRVTTSTATQRSHITDKRRISFSDGNGDNAYTQNIQIAELNAFNAALAVIKWKKLLGFYRDLENEHHSVYTIDGNTITNEDKI